SEPPPDSLQRKPKNTGPNLSAAQTLPDCCDYVLDITVVQAGRERQTHSLTPDAGCFRAHSRVPSVVLLIVGVFGQTEIVHPNANVFGGHCLQEGISTDAGSCFIDLYGVEMVGVASIG